MYKRQQINSPALVKSLSDIEPNYKVKLGAVQCMLDGTAVGDKLSEILSSIRKKNIEGKFSVAIQTYITNSNIFPFILSFINTKNTIRIHCIRFLWCFCFKYYIVSASQLFQLLNKTFLNLNNCLMDINRLIHCTIRAVDIISKVYCKFTRM